MNDRAGGTTPWRRTEPELHEGLASWARQFRGRGAVVTEVNAPVNGMANDTILFCLDGEPLVARLAPAPGSAYPTFPTYDLELQRRVIELVRERTAVPVPEVVHLELSDQWLGVPFLVVRAVDGVVPSDNPPYLIDPNGWFLQGTPQQWKRFEASTIDVLVKLHRISAVGPAGVGSAGSETGEALAFLQPDATGETALAQQLAYQRRYYEWARDGHTIPILERAFDVLGETIPPNDRRVLNWGDSRPGNIIYRDFEPVAVLDWEMATVGPPEVDIAWLTFFHRFFAGMAEQYGLPPVPAMFDRAHTAATYARLSGEPVDDLAWYEALAGLRFGIILVRMTLRSAAFGMQSLPENPDDMTMFAPLLERLLQEI